MNFIKREKLTSPRVWTSLIPNIEFTQMELLQSEQKRKYRIELEETGWNKVIVPAKSAVTKVEPRAMENGYPKPLGNAFNGVRSFYQVPWCAGWDRDVYDKLNSWYFTIFNKIIHTQNNISLWIREKGKKLFQKYFMVLDIRCSTL